MLHQRYPLETLGEILIPHGEYHPYPTVEEREAWLAVPAHVRTAYLTAAEALLDFEYPSLPATLFLQFSRMGNRRNYEKPHFLRRGALEVLVSAECLEGEGRFLDDIVNGIWAICEESYWGVPAHIRVQKAGNTLPDSGEPTVDLFAAETGNLLAWTYYLLGERLDDVSPVVRDRLRREIDHRILTPLFVRDDFHWMGLKLRPDQRRVNNWNPWICSNWLSAALLMETDTERRQRTVARILRTLDNFIDPYPADGGCDEGPSYWGRAGASLFDNLELLRGATRGQIDVYPEPKIREIGRFIYRVHIAGDYYINFADAPALVYPDPMIVYLYGARIDDPDMVAHGRWLAEHLGLHDRVPGASATRPTNFQRVLRMFFHLDEVEPGAAPPLPKDVWLPEIQVVVARDEAGSSAGFFLGAKGGHNSESHNHNDVGNFVVYLDGKPLLVDAGVETYTARTFSAERYTIWTMQSAYHTLLPTVDGMMQEAGAEYAARDVQQRTDNASAEISLDIAGAYPADAPIERWRRSLRLERGEGVTVVDDFALSREADAIQVSIVTPCAVDASRPGTLLLGERPIVDGRISANGRLSYDADRFQASVETISIADERLGGTWGTQLYRAVLTARHPAREERWTFMVRRP